MRPRSAKIRLLESGGLAILAAALSLGLPSATFGQSGYTFTRIADTTVDAGLGGVSCVGLSNTGTVIVVFVPAGSPGRQLWKGDGVTFSQVAPSVASLCASINGLDETAYVIQVAASTFQLVTNSAGTLATLASTPLLNPSLTHHPALSDGGSAVFVSGSTAGPGIRVGPAGPIVYDPAIHPVFPGFASPVSMNDSATVVFGASSAAGARGIYRGSVVPLIETGDAVSGGTIGIGLQAPLINNSGTVAFIGGLTGSSGTTSGIFTTSDGVTVTRVGLPPADGIGGSFSVNNAGVVAYRKVSGLGSGLSLGRPGAVDTPVISFNGSLDGSVLHGVFVWPESLNDKGQIAFWADLADGRRGIYRADPPPANLQVAAIKAPKVAASGGSITVRDTTRNAGTGGAPETTTRIWLSTNKTLGPGDVDLGSRALPNLAAGAQNAGPTTVTIPAIPPGAYYLLAEADADDDAAESEETDNVKAKALIVGPDLLIKTLAFDPASPTSSAPTTITVTVDNAGGQSAGPTVTRVYRSANGKLDPSDTLLAELPLGGLASGASVPQSTALTLPAGTYYVIVVCDAAGAVGEAKETNNMKKILKTIP
jgi:hypothetical protein